MNDAALPSDCSSGYAFTTFSAWRDHLLPADEAQRFSSHLASCATCCQWLVASEALTRSLVGARELAPGDRVWRGVRARLMQKERPIMRTHALWGGVSAVAIIILLAVLFAKVFASTGPSTPGSHTTTVPATATAIAFIQPTATPGAATSPVATPAATATPSPTPAPACSGTANSGGNTLANVPLPPGTLLGGGSLGAADGVQYSYSFDRISTCTPSSTPASVRGFFATQMPANGWTQTSTFPDGTAGKCADQYCWTRSTGAKTARYVGLLAVQAQGRNTVYVLDVLNLVYNN